MMMITSNIQKVEIDQENKKLYVYCVQDNSHLLTNRLPSYYREVYSFDNLEFIEIEYAKVERASEKITYKDMEKKENTAESVDITQEINENIVKNLAVRLTDTELSEKIKELINLPNVTIIKKTDSFGNITYKGVENDSILEKIPTFPLSVASDGQFTSTVGAKLGTEFTLTGNTTIDQWNNPERVEVNIIGEAIEMVYKQTSILTPTVHFNLSPQERVFRIVYSCVDGKWNKSEPIYGKIIPSQDEYYDFEQ